MKPTGKIDMDKAISEVKDYCGKNLLDYSKVDYISQIWDEILFGIWKKDIATDGLVDDIASQPDIVLEYKMDGSISKTDLTHLLEV